MAALWAVWMSLAAWGLRPVTVMSRKSCLKSAVWRMPYAVLNANQLPTLEALRAAFLEDTASARPTGYELETAGRMPLSQPADTPVVPGLVPASMGIRDDKADLKFAVPWDDSFIMGEEAKNPDSHKH